MEESSSIDAPVAEDPTECPTDRTAFARSFVDQLLTEAIRRDVSGIHVEPIGQRRLEEVRVRFRRDGFLETYRTLPVGMLNAVTCVIKEMTALDVAEKKLPQDGLIKLRGGDDVASEADRPLVDVRVSVLPTNWGERIVMRLTRHEEPPRLTEIGLDPVALERLKERIQERSGLILVTGPGGSGRTTSAYSMLASLDRDRLNLTTVEDPIDYPLRGIAQLNCRPEIGLTFASGLRSLVRQDADVILVGEIRYYETAELAVQTSMSGRLILGIVNTDGTVSTLRRLVDIGLETYLIDSTLRSVLTQRLARKVCPDCREEWRAPRETAERLGLHSESLRRIGCDHIDPLNLVLVRGTGCDLCGKTGYRGRAGVFEYLEMTPSVRELFLGGGSLEGIKTVACGEGMLTLRESALRLALLGVTSAEEAVRISPPDRDPSSLRS